MRELRWAVVALGLAAMTMGQGGASKVPTAPAVDLDSMIFFEAGTFRMGVEADQVASPYGDRWFYDHRPAHDVTLSAFYLDPRPVTVAEFALFLTYAAGEYHHRREQPIDRVADGYLPAAGFSDHPITYVTWEAAHHYCLWAGKRLPTEAEWERAAAGLEGRAHPWGEEGADCDRAAIFTGSSFCEAGPLPVGSHPNGATPAGVEGLGGNVAEWVADVYGLYPAEPQQDPTGPAEGWYRSVRGGSYQQGGIMARTHARRHARPDRGSSSIGFRCAYDAPSDDGLRGDLTPPEDRGREVVDRFVAEATPRPTRLVEGLDEPIDLVAADGAHFVLERGAGRVTRLSLGDGQAEPWITGLDDPRHLAIADVIVVTDAGGLSRFSLAGDPLPAVSSTDATQVVAVGDAAYVATGDGVVFMDGTAVQPLSSQTAIEALALAGDLLVYAAGPDGSRQVGRVTLSSGDEQILVEPDLLEPGYYPSAVAIDGSEVWFIQRRDGFPNGGLLCHLPVGGGTMDCVSHSPAHPQRLMVDGGRILWAGRQVIAEADQPDGDWRVVQPWVRAGGLILEGDSLVYSDEQDGRIYRLP